MNRMAREGIIKKEIFEFTSKGNKETPCGYLEEESYRQKDQQVQMPQDRTVPGVSE